MSSKDVPNIKEQYKQGPPQMQERQLTPEEQEKERDKLTAIYDKDIPFLRKQEEYNRLMLKILEQQVLLGTRPINTIRGLLGPELAVREIQAMTFMAQFQNEVEANQRQQEEMKKEQPTNQ